MTPTAWLGVAPDDPFGIDNLPIGSVVTANGRRFAAIRIGSYALDLVAAGAPAHWFVDGTLDAFLAAGRPTWQQLRADVTSWLTDPEHRRHVESALVPLDELSVTLGFTIGDYVDFYASQHHASNVGKILRPNGAPLTPNYQHLPLGYHGRSGTIVVSGTDIRRPNGQIRAADGGARFGPSRRLDLEAELAFVVGPPSTHGHPVPISQFRNHVFGVCLLNDWSARDIQSWEYVPLGPFLGKSFATSVAGWITPLDALAAAWVPPPVRDVEVLPYLDDPAALGLSIALEIQLNTSVIARPPYAAMYWTPAQMLAHMTVNGAHVRTGDVFASGTVSGPQPSEWGSLLELSWNSTQPIRLGNGDVRSFLEDGDEVVITGSAPGPNGRIALAEVRGRIVG